jgi:DNA gyrase/topoisomerase IV subunit A
MKENIENVNIEVQSREDMKAYAIYVARCRAIPDAIDGLKPVIRRILWCVAHDFKGQGSVKTAAVLG